MTIAIEVLILVLLCLSIVTVIRLWSVLGSARVTLANLEETRLEANETLKRLSEVAVSTDRVMREEVAPTLQMTRATLENVEATTRALAQTTQAFRRMTGHAESITTAQKLLALGGSVAQNVFGGRSARSAKNGQAEPSGRISSPKQGTFAAGRAGFGIAFAIASKLRGMMTRQGAAEGARRHREVEPVTPSRALPSSDAYEGTTLIVGKDTALRIAAPESSGTSRSGSGNKERVS